MRALLLSVLAGRTIGQATLAGETFPVEGALAGGLLMSAFSPLGRVSPCCTGLASAREWGQPGSWRCGRSCRVRQHRVCNL